MQKEPIRAPLARLRWAAACLLLTACGASKQAEPSHNGHPLSEWVVRYAATGPDTASHKEAEQAIQRIGTNAIPHLLRWIAEAQDPSPGEGPAPAHLKQAKTRALAAPSAFTALQEQAATAIPELANTLTNGNDLASAYAAHSLGRIGPPGLPALISALDSPRPQVRKNAADYMIYMGTNAQPAIPALERLRNDPAPQVRAAVTNILQVLNQRRPSDQPGS